MCQRFIFYLSLIKSFRVRQTYSCIVCTIFSKCSSALKNRLVQNKLNKNFSNKSKMQKVLSHLIVQNFQLEKNTKFLLRMSEIFCRKLWFVSSIRKLVKKLQIESILTTKMIPPKVFRMIGLLTCVGVSIASDPLNCFCFLQNLLIYSLLTFANNFLKHLKRKVKFVNYIFRLFS
jgi:hypothetical protein